MKRIFLAACMGIAAFAAQASSNASKETTVSYLARQTFAKEFGDVKNVAWKSIDNNLVKAVFEEDGKEVTAFIRYDGELVATTTAMQQKQLPSKVKAAIQKLDASQQIHEVFYMEHPTESAYYFSIEKEGSKKVYRALKNGNLRDVSKQVL
jgi:hypothetical protein